MFEEALSKFSDVTVYFFMGAIGTVIFIIKMVLLLVVGVDDGGDFDVDAADGDLEAHGSDFSLFSLLSIISFMMGAGWFGYAARIEWDWGHAPAAAGASAFGFALMLFSSMLLWQMKKFNQQGRYNIHTSVGHTGRGYLEIPARGEGTGQVEMDIDGRKSILTAKSSGDAISSFTAVKVLEVQDGDILLVEPI